MQVIPIQALANQQFTIPLDNNQWDMTIKSTNGTISVSLILNGVVILENARAVGGMRIIPSEYEEAGNFAFVTKNYELPDYTQFGQSQSLIYISQADLDALRIPPPAILTSDDFDQNAALPLRFFPQGYTLA